MHYVREDILLVLLSHDFSSTESFFGEINLYKKKWLINCSYNPHKSNIGIISVLLDTHSTKYVVRCTIWYYLYNLKNVKNIHGGVLILVKLQAEACNFTKINTLPWVFFRLFK